MADTLPERVQAADDVLWQEVDGQVVFLELGAGHYFTLDAVGSRMWQELLAGPDVDAVLQRLLAVYEVDEKTLRHDVAALIEQLEQRRLLRCS